ncbi:hypothetical protein [Pararhodobacter sp.]|uniref:hypothetical protein n=1 Tax=Pararhodobacter sp. TaxID=2127056 RepID=UPI003FA71852
MNMPNTPTRPAGRRATNPPEKAGQVRDERLKAALKANLARRKAQARARSQDKNPDKEGTPDHG